MATRLVSVVVDCADPRELGSWWARALGWAVTSESSDEVGVAPQAAAAGGDPGCGAAGGIGLVFVPVPEPKVGPDQVHLDLSSVSPQEHRASVDHLLEAGAHEVDLGERTGAPFTVLADPAGNEFCVLEPKDVYRDTGAIAAVAVNCPDPVGFAGFWSAVSGWPVARSKKRFAGLRAPGGRGPYLELLPSAGAGLRPRPKDRVHLDVAPFAGADQAAETARLVAAGARPTDVGQLGPDGARRADVTWDVLVAPDGHEFCVLGPR